MSVAAAGEGLLFAGDPLQTLEASAGVIRRDKPQFMRRAFLVVAVGWLPLALLTVLHGDFISSDKGNSFLVDFGVHTRFLLAAPLLILAEAICVPRLAAIARQFIDADLVTDADRQRYNSAVASSQRLMKSRIIEIALTVLAYALAVMLVWVTPPETLPAWYGRSSPFAASPAGWWASFVSLPLLLLLLLGWLWRICVWTRFLWLMNRLPLQLDPAHPDHAGGLGFLSSSLEGFIPIGFTIGVIAAGPVANQVVHHHASPLQFRPVAYGAIISSIVLCATPLLIFLHRLIEVRHRGVLQYGALAMHMSERFQPRWLSPPPRLNQGALDMSEFTGTNAVYTIAANALAVRILPLELRSVWLLSLATFLPFFPVWLLAVPFTELAKKIGASLL
jgi:hypothetical protein